jgi:hypothetical protein
VKVADHPLTDAQVVAIREAMAAGTPGPRALARQYGVSRQTIHNLARHTTRKAAGGPVYQPSAGPRTNTGYWGVTANGAGNRFAVALTHNHRRYTFGTCRSALESVRLYDAKARELGVPPAKLNFPDD